MSSAARRRHYRVQVDQSSKLAVEVLRGGQASRKYSLRDVSLGGLGLVLPPGELTWLGPGDQADLRLYLPGRPQPLVVRGSVIRRQPLPPSGAPGPAGAPDRPGAQAGAARANAGGQGDLLALQILESSGLAQQLDPGLWTYFNRRAQQRGDLCRERLEVRLLSPTRSLRAELHDLSLGGLSVRWSAPSSAPPAAGERFRVGLRLEAGGALLTYEATVAHTTQRAGGLRIGLCFDGQRSPRLPMQAVPIGQALVRAQLALNRAAAGP